MPGLDGKEPTRDELNAEAVAQGLGDFVIEGLTKAEQVAVLKAADIYRTKLGEQLALAKAETEAVSAAAQAAIDNANSAIAAAPIPEGKSFGGLPGSSVLVLMTVTDADQNWRRPQEVNSTWVVDFTGPNAEFLATRCRRPISQLADGTWRIQAENQPQAGVIWDAANVWCREQGDTVTKAERGPKGCDSMLARDAVRGVSAAPGAGRVFLASPRGWSVSTLPDGSVLLRQA